MLEEGGREQAPPGRGATKTGDAGVKSERQKKKGGRRSERKGKKNRVHERRMEEREREKEKKSQVPVSCLLQGSQRHEAKGTPPARKEQRR